MAYHWVHVGSLKYCKANNVIITRQKIIGSSSRLVALGLFCWLFSCIHLQPICEWFNERAGLYGDIVMSESGAPGWGTTWSALRMRPDWAIFLNFLFRKKNWSFSSVFIFLRKICFGHQKRKKKILAQPKTRGYFSLSKIFPGPLLCACQLGFTGRANHRISWGGALPHAESELSYSIWQHWFSPGPQS